MKVDVKESSIVQPAQDTPVRHLWVSNLDLFQARLHLGLVYLYRSSGCSSFFDTRVIKEALSRVLVPYYPAAGRLRRDQNGRLEIHCNGEGVLFVEAEADSTVDGLGDFTQNSDLRQLVPAVDYSGDISSYPLVLIQLTFFKCGGVCVGVGWHLILSDGPASTQFTKSWADAARGLPITITPFIDRTVLGARFPPVPAFRHPEFDPPPTMNTQNFQSSLHSTVVLNITLDQLKILKKRVNDGKTSTNYTTHEVLVAHIWRCVSKARGLADDQATRLHITANGRSRLSPPLPQNYFGCAIFPVRPVALAGDLQAEPLICTVERIHRAIKRMDDQYLRSAIDCLEQHPDREALVPKEGNQIYGCPNLSIVSWTRLPMEEVDFGSGRPTHTGPASMYSEGKGYILRSPDNGGGLQLAICLQANHMNRFKKLFYELTLVSAM